MEKKFAVGVGPDDDGERLDRFLTEKTSGDYSRVFVQKMITAGHVLVDGVSKKRNYRLSDGERVTFSVPKPVERSIEGEDIPLEIVYEDSHLLVVNKPAGMVVHPAPGNYTGTMVNALVHHCKVLSGIGGELKPGIVHRLDKGTSGLLVVAKDDKTHRLLSQQFKDKTTKRVYIGLVKGVVELDNGVVELPIGRSTRDRMRMAVDMESEKTAVTRYRVIKRFKRFTELELVLGTGRTHQIRVHMSYIGHPILGDETYGTKEGFARPALHAKMLGFMHPVTKKYMEFTSDLPSDIKKILKTGDADK